MTDETGTAVGPGGAATDREDLPDPALFWRWAGGAVRPVIGWVLAALGVLVIFLGWYGISGQSIVAEQLPYLISGGLGGVALVGIGAAFIGTEWLRREATRVERLEEMVAELRDVLLAYPEASAPAEQRDGVVSLVAIPTGSTFHTAGCAMMRNKSGVEPVTARSIGQRGLSPCRICEPAVLSS
ncbi:MAG TPA: hypothetical protein VNF50_02815 [Acidimicrobiales bacterium]|nr:hypothetical protein [Acidimicrobiales bacterium]